MHNKQTQHGVKARDDKLRAKNGQETMACGYGRKKRRKRRNFDVEEGSQTTLLLPPSLNGVARQSRTIP
jgi:hypothetical protein